MQPEDSTKLIELYRSRYPFVDATFFRAGSAPLLNRILTEARAGRFLFDVVSGKVSDLLLLQKRGLLGRIVSAEFSSYPDQFKDKQRRWVDLYNNYYTIAYNVNRVRSYGSSRSVGGFAGEQMERQSDNPGSAQLRLVFRHALRPGAKLRAMISCASSAKTNPHGETAMYSSPIS